MLKRLLFVFAILLTPAFAQALELYVGGGVGSEVEAGTVRSEVSGSAGTTTTGDRYKVFAGLGLGRTFAVEVTYYDFGGQRCCNNVVDLGFDTEIDGTSAALVGRLPLGKLTLFGKAGLVHWSESGDFITILGSTHRSESGTDLVTGAGLEFRITERFGVRGEWERFDFGDGSSDGVWAAVKYRIF